LASSQNKATIYTLFLAEQNTAKICTHFSGNARKTSDGVVSNSVIYFTPTIPINHPGPAPLKLFKILDLVSFGLFMCAL
jgi:hypothetical protein